MTHDPRLTRALRDLLSTRRVAALGTLDARDNARPFVSMVPFARLGAEGCLVIHVSGLAAHTRNLLAHPQVSLLVMAAEADDEPVHALPRVTLDAVAQLPERDSPAWTAARAAYLARFPEAAPMTERATSCSYCSGPPARGRWRALAPPAMWMWPSWPNCCVTDRLTRRKAVPQMQRGFPSSTCPHTLARC